MRDIKFRVWDNEENNFWGEGRNLSMISLVSDSVVNDDSTVLEQYTGLKDKNGVEIYEGDIVQYGNNKHDNCVVKFGEFGVPEIESEQYVDRAVGFYLKSIGDLKDVAPFNMTIPLNERYAKGYQVIGNIHQNKNLLVNDTDRISPDDIGNDIHEFLHGGER